MTDDEQGGGHTADDADRPTGLDHAAEGNSAGPEDDPAGPEDDPAGPEDDPAGPEDDPAGPENDPADDSPSVSRGARVFVAALVAVGLTIGGVVASLLGAVPLLLWGRDSVLGVALGITAGELGFVLVGLLFLVVTGRGVDYLDLELPGTHRQWAIVVGFTLGAFLVRTLAIVVVTELGVQPAESNIASFELPFEVLAAILLPAMLLVVGPAEELLFRGVIQKYLREELSAWPAILGAGLLFGVIHVFSLLQSTGLGTVVSLVVITAVGFGLGWLYEHTGSLPAAMLAHGGYNALIVASAYALQVTGG